jgi:hypothetical protein
MSPGITDLASIVFADEGEILRGSEDPDLRYNQLIRPWKSRLGLLYVDSKPGVATDFRIIWLTVYSAINRQAALAGVRDIAATLGASQQLQAIILRSQPLPAAPPPGASEIAQTRAVVA